jgi:hypothetical protein
MNDISPYVKANAGSFKEGYGYKLTPEAQRGVEAEGVKA